MDRNYLNEFIIGQYAPLLTAASAGMTDDLNGFAPALDSVMSQLGLATQGTDSNPTITSGLEGDALLLTRYYALDWLLGLFAMQVDFQNTQDVGMKLSQRYAAISKELARLKAQIPSIYPLEPGDFEFGRVQLDFLENNPIYGPGYPAWWG